MVRGTTIRAMSTPGVPLWQATAPAVAATAPRTPLDRDVDADVVIVGAGYTGLWSAYYLAAARPDWRIVGIYQGGLAPPRGIVSYHYLTRIMRTSHPRRRGRSHPATAKDGLLDKP